MICRSKNSIGLYSKRHCRRLGLNRFCAKSRRVKKVTPAATTIFLYDDWNLIEERIAYANGTTSTIHYYWGKDLSGEMQGAGGVGGLIYLTIDDVIYIPCYDNNGNVTKYVDPNGSVVASYTYDAFGKIIGKTGSLTDFFRHCFSTKYFDTETGFYYYGYRFYNPEHMRWLNRDPIGENGGVNLYGFCGNDPVGRYDKDGRAYFIKRRMDWLPWMPFVSENAQRDIDNRELVHEQLIFQDAGNPSDVGYSREGIIKNDDAWKTRKWVRVPGSYNDCVMRKAVALVSPLPYCLWGNPKKGITQYNCQDYADALRAKYNELIFDKKIRCECGLDKDRR